MPPYWLVFLPQLLPLVDHRQGVFPRKVAAYAVGHSQDEARSAEDFQAAADLTPHCLRIIPAQEPGGADAGPGSGAALYSDLDLSALKGAFWRSGGSAGLLFLPLADGTFQTRMRDLNDFRVMQRGTCLGLHGLASELYCGTADSSLWGF